MPKRLQHHERGSQPYMKMCSSPTNRFVATNRCAMSWQTEGGGLKFDVSEMLKNADQNEAEGHFYGSSQDLTAALWRDDHKPHGIQKQRGSQLGIITVR